MAEPTIYKAPVSFIENGDEIYTSFKQEAELQEREEDDKPNPVFTTYRNANGRAWLKNGKTLRVLVEVNGVVDKTNPVAIVKSSCGVLERQPVYIRVRMEEPSTNIPTGPALEAVIP